MKVDTPESLEVIREEYKKSKFKNKVVWKNEEEL
jgi:hypothetical protein